MVKNITEYPGGLDIIAELGCLPFYGMNYVVAKLIDGSYRLDSEDSSDALNVANSNAEWSDTNGVSALVFRRENGAVLWDTRYDFGEFE